MLIVVWVMSQTLEKRFSNREKAHIRVSKETFNPIMRTRKTKEEQHRPWNQESTSSKWKAYMRYYRNKSRAALKPRS